jgi:hypothetical protein
MSQITTLSTSHTWKEGRRDFTPKEGGETFCFDGFDFIPNSLHISRQPAIHPAVTKDPEASTF